jgi:hypothetical protein
LAIGGTTIAAFSLLFSPSDYNHAPLLSHSLTSPISPHGSYRQCLPSRFKKDLVKVIASDGIETLLKNIGASERMSRTEIDTILAEAGSADRKTIPANKMALLL